MVTLTPQQMTALCRFNREYSIQVLELTNDEDSIVTVHAILNAGKKQIEKDFQIDVTGVLARRLSNEGSQT